MTLPFLLLLFGNRPSYSGLFNKLKYVWKSKYQCLQIRTNQSITFIYKTNEIKDQPERAKTFTERKHIFLSHMAHVRALNNIWQIAGVVERTYYL
jgi:hypothetical protein